MHRLCPKFSILGAALSGQEPVRLPEKLDSQLALLFDYLRQHRCSLASDNANSIMMQAADELESNT